MSDASESVVEPVLTPDVPIEPEPAPEPSLVVSEPEITVIEPSVEAGEVAEATIPVPEPPPEEPPVSSGGAPAPTPAPSPTPPAQPLPPAPPSIASRLGEALEALRFRKRARLEKILVLAAKKGKIKNDDVEKLLRVSDTTATNYLNALVLQAKLRRVGSGHQPTYEPL